MYVSEFPCLFVTLKQYLVAVKHDINVYVTIPLLADMPI